ncbi:UTRA domain-containing protein [Antribacter sp. KLBMP9083]|uniref:UTRA domain-containing protein n=1 Tax=Antribacter soli TaxID=2910976 RepID=A0AA41U8R4_9MICO|nr:UTRA domain-containing protein [Antribacter soli]MCF4123001.1 UTRA domain-containing protein [Antribacter soli]
MSDRRQWVSVSAPYVSGQPGDAWAAEAAAQGGAGTQKLVAVGEVPAPDLVARLLGLEAGEPVVLRSRVMLLDERPVELVDSYYPAAIAGDTLLAERRKVPGGAVSHLTQLGYPPRRAVEDVTARLATQAEIEELGLAAPACVLEIARVILSDDDVPVEATFMTSPADSRRLRYEVAL